MTKDQRQYNGEKTASSTNGAGTTEHPLAKKKKKKNVGTELTFFIKINSEWITDLNIKFQTIELLEDDRTKFR